MMEERLSVFVSSILGELQEERQAVKEAVEGIPLAKPWVFEHTPPSTDSLDESYLSKVRDCDVFILILAQSVSAPVRAEYETARAHGKPRLIFLKAVDRSQESQMFVDEIDVKWAQFTRTDDLKQLVQEALTDELIKGYRRYHLKGSEVGQLADFMDKLSRGVVLGDESIQATIVKEGDQLAIGDRILQIGENIGGEVHYEVRDSVTGPVHSGTGDIVINPEQDLEAIFEKLRRLVAAQPRLPPAEQEEITGKLSELQSELAGPEPDLGTIQRLKKFLSEKGPWMAAGINALFSNPSVVQVVKQAAQRLLGA